MDRGRLSGKQIYRTIAFQYHQGLRGISVDLLATIVSNIFYPKDRGGEAAQRYMLILKQILKDYSEHESFISETQFVNFFEDMKKYQNSEYAEKIARRIFLRYANKDGFIEEEGYSKLHDSLQLPSDEMKQHFFAIADRKNQISFEKFFDFFRGLLI